MLTSASDPHSQSEALKLGAIDFVTKPFRVEDLERRIGRVMHIVSIERRLEQAEAQLKELRGVDQVTGVGAASQLYTVLEAEFHAAEAGGRALSIIVVSDEHYDLTLWSQGRPAGEARLHQLADAIEKRLRGADRVFRVDAAEFVVLLPGTAREGARAVVNKLQEAAVELGGIHPDELAVAVAVVPHPELRQASQMYRAVNMALAQARSAGQVAFFEGF